MLSSISPDNGVGSREVLWLHDEDELHGSLVSAGSDHTDDFLVSAVGHRLAVDVEELVPFFQWRVAFLCLRTRGRVGYSERIFGLEE